MAKPRQSKEEKALEKEIDLVYRQNCCNIQIDMMAIPEIFKVGRKARAEGRDLKEAIVTFVESIRRN